MLWSDLLPRDRSSLSLRPEIVDLGLEPVYLTQFCPQSCTKLLFERTLWLFWTVSPTTYFIMTFGQRCRLVSVGDILESELHTNFPLTVLLWYKKFPFVLDYFEIKETPPMFLYLVQKSSK